MNLFKLQIMPIYAASKKIAEKHVGEVRISTTRAVKTAAQKKSDYPLALAGPVLYVCIVSVIDTRFESRSRKTMA
jgi:hypothetical protein